MNYLILTFLLLPFAINAQYLYSGVHGEYNHKWFLQINADSSIVLLRNIGDSGFDEYRGKISKKDDSLFVINAKSNFIQTPCLSVGESDLLVSLDSIFKTKIGTITLVYSNSQKINVPVNNRENIEIPLSSKISRSDPKKEFFYVTVHHKNPIDDTEMKTHYKNKDSYCLELLHGECETFSIIIKNDKVRKIGKGVIPNFTLSKVPE